MNYMKSLGYLGTVILLFALQGCAGLTANTISDGGDKHLGLKGHDPVAYFTDGKHMLGDAKFKTLYGKRTFRQGLETMLADPRAGAFWCAPLSCAQQSARALDRGELPQGTIVGLGPVRRDGGEAALPVGEGGLALGGDLVRGEQHDQDRAGEEHADVDPGDALAGPREAPP